MFRSFEEIDVLHDLEEEKRQQRYLDLIGHTDQCLYLNAWSPENGKQLREQHKESNKFGFLTEQELSLHKIESNNYSYVYDTKTKMCTIPYIIIGEPCAICFDPITTRKNAYYTECGHKLHKTCITNYYNSTCNNQNHGYGSNWKIKCPLCREHLLKCLWLEKRYLTNPFIEKASRWNLIYEDYPQFFNHDIIECAGCGCTDGCGNLCGSKYKLGCSHCYRWRYFTYKDLMYHHMICEHDPNNAQIASRKAGRDCIGQCKRMLRMLFSVRLRSWSSLHWHSQ
jgi:hypothetical protein